MEVFWELSTSSVFAGALDVEAPATPGKNSLQGEAVESHHSLDACFLCDKPIAGDKPVFMYRGDVPFCSEDCRQAQIGIDEVLGDDRVLSKSSTAADRSSADAAAAAVAVKRKPTLIFTHKDHLGASTAIVAS